MEDSELNFSRRLEGDSMVKLLGKCPTISTHSHRAASSLDNFGATLLRQIALSLAPVSAKL